MIYGYARANSVDNTIASQEKRLKEYGAEKIYSDVVSVNSDNIQNIENLTKLLEKLKENDTLVVTKLDRLGQTIKQLIPLFDSFNKSNIRFVSILDNFDSASPEGQYCLKIFSVLAETETTIVGDHIKIGIKLSRKLKNIRIGRPPVDKKQVDKALKMYYMNEFSLKDITAITGVTKSTLYKYIQLYKEKGES